MALWLSSSLMLLMLLLTTTKTTTLRCNALKVSVSIPELVKINDAFWLNCSHDKQSLHQQQQLPNSDQQPIGGGGANYEGQKEDIYAIKWYKDDEEFYRFLPNAQPKVSIYETSGIQLDQAKSHYGNVLISKADVNSEGNYRCEILSEAPLFETVRKSKHLKVYALPVRSPRIEILDSQGRVKSPKAQEISYAVGDKIELQCKSAPSKPAARLRWYLNDHELIIPSANYSTSGSERHKRTSLSGQPLTYDVKVTPIEYRQHYKGIYSSHSSLSLVLQQDDLINNKISFKCLGSMRQDVAVKSKQLILLAAPSSQALKTTSPTGLPDSRRRAKRFAELVASAAALTADADAPDVGETHVHHRQRPQHQRHSISRLSQQATSSRYQQQPKQASALSSDLINGLVDNPKDSMMYIYEDSDSTLGSSIIDTLDNLESYLRGKNTTNGVENSIYQPLSSSGSYSAEFNRADNLEYIQLLRERLSRQRSFLISQQSGSGSGVASGTHSSKRLHGPNSLVKSPLYLDELDALRPIISWPPLDSGKLTLLPPGNNIVAIPTQPVSINRRIGSANEPRFILPPKADSNEFESLQVSRGKVFPYEADDLDRQVMLERLLQALNCTTTEGSIDTKLNWMINETPVDIRDTRLFPTRVSLDHRQTLLTVGFQSNHNQHPSAMEYPSKFYSQASSSSLNTILAPYLKNSDYQKGVRFDTMGPSLSRSDSRSAAANAAATTTSTATNQQASNANNQIKVVCQAVHSMLLYSSSEMITFDFNPPPLSQLDTNSIDKISSLPANVIQAASASQSSSASGIIYFANPFRSQIILTLLCLTTISIRYTSNHAAIR